MEESEKGVYDNPALEISDDGNRGNNDVGGGDHSSNFEGHENKVEFEDLEFEPNWVTNLEDKWTDAKSRLGNLLLSICSPKLLQSLPCLAGHALYNIFFFGAIYHYSVTDTGLEWCDGLGFLIIITVTFYAMLFYSKAVKPWTRTFMKSSAGKKFSKGIIDPVTERYSQVVSHRFSTLTAAVLLFAIVLIVIVVDSADNRERLISAFGLLVLIFIGFVFSKHPGRVVWRHIIWGIALQFIFGLVILKWTVGKSIFQCLGDKVTTFLDFTDQGSTFVYGPLVSQKPFWTSALNKSGIAFAVATEINESKAFAWVFMFKILSVVYFFSFFISMLFYLGWMQWIVIQMGWILQITVGTTACESLASAANIFLGQSEAPLMIKPYLSIMTNSELHAVMTGGFANIAGSVLAAYISFGISASHLISASVMSAPGSLAIAKLMYPETKKTKTLPEDLKMEKGPEANLLDAASQGAVTAVFLVGNIAGTLIAVLAFIAFINGVLTWCGTLVGIQGLTFEVVLGKLFIPLAWLMGVPSQDLDKVGVLLGLKTFINEFVAYDRMAQYGSTLSPRARVISTYALCGFSNPASVGIQIAALGTMAPERRSDVAQMAFRAFVAGSISCFLSACVAGMLIDAE